MNLPGRAFGRWSTTTSRWLTAAPAKTGAPWVCTECRVQAAARSLRIPKNGAISTWPRDFSTTTKKRDDKTEERLRRIQEENAARIRKEEDEARILAEQKAQRLREEEAEAQRAAAEAVQSTAKPNTSSSLDQESTDKEKSLPATPAESSTTLPSHAESRRSDLQKRFTHFLDELLLHASRIGQQVNQYTGTDYSGIENLRREISSQEQKVRTLRRAVDSARTVHHDAYAQQTASQREIVALLERKSSWSPTDLERYMSLVRSEHLNEQSVSSAKANLDQAENSLEEARSLLERLERKQYHEEQIWSDTIRRNSTWVTFGLMGVNIVLLLANIVIFEPWRRRKIAKDVGALLEERTVHRSEVPNLVETSEKGVQVDEEDLERLQSQEGPQRAEEDKHFAAVSPEVERQSSTAPLTAGEMLPLEASEVVGAVPNVSADITESKVAETDSSEPVRSMWEFYQDSFNDLFSERIVRIRKVDLTNIALQGAASGFAIMGLLFVLLRPK